MNIKWAYCLIGIIYAMLIFLKGINYLNKREYISNHPDALKAFSVKKDFFTTVAIICMIVTVGINGAALIGGRPLNTSSIIITFLVIGFTMLNSFSYIYLSRDEKNLLLLGYILQVGDVETIKVKHCNKKNILSITFNKEIESYNYIKISIYGEHKERVTKGFEQLKAVSTQDKSF